MRPEKHLTSEVSLRNIRIRSIWICFGVHGRRLATRVQARQVVMDWITFYNHSRPHWALGCLSPMQFEQRLVGGAAQDCRLMIGLCTPISRGNLKRGLEGKAQAAALRKHRHVRERAALGLRIAS
jgi:hypothetical protein